MASNPNDDVPLATEDVSDDDLAAATGGAGGDDERWGIWTGEGPFSAGPNG